MDPLVRNAIARIDIMQDGRSVSRGTGTLVTDRLVLTALHVVADRAQQPPTPLPGTIRVTFPSGSCDAVVMRDYVDAQADWALVECQAPPRVRPLPLGELTSTDSEFTAYGFPDAQPQDGMVHTGTVENSAAEIFGVSAVQLFSKQAAAGDGEPVKGLSGAPLIIEGALVGVLRVSLMKDQRNVAGTLYATPLGPIADRCGAVLPLPDPCRGLPGLKAQPLQPTPFRFLDPFTDKDAEIFFGRNREIRALYDRLTADTTPPILLLYGQSGVGKSSVLDAGVRPRLTRTHHVRYVRRSSGTTLLDTLLGTLTGGAASGATGDQIAAAWAAAEASLGRPVVVFLDQVDEVYTRAGAETDEDDHLFEALKALWSEGGKPPAGRLVLSFRKEWLSEIQQQLELRGLPYEKVFLQGLDRDAIVHVVSGITRSRRLRDHYGLVIESGLPERIADELLSDRDSPIAPTLQILLSKLWQMASTADRHAPAFTKALYESLQRDGLLLGDFLDQQLARIGQHTPEFLSSGLALDLLAFHTTPLLTTPLRSRDELVKAYTHRAADLLPLLRLCQELYLLTDTAADTAATGGATRLSHDTLAPLVRARFDDSVMPGQRARRLIESHGAQWREHDGPTLDASDLEIVRQGLQGMRALKPEEERLLQVSEQRRQQELRKQRRVTRVIQGAAVAVLIAVLWGAWNLRLANLREEQLYVTLQAPLESHGWTADHARRATTNEIAASVAADDELQRLAPAPKPRRTISVQYAPAGVDAERVVAALRQHGFLVDSGQALPPDTATRHAIEYGADVTMTAVQQVAYTLIRAGVGVFGVHAFENPIDQAGIIRVVGAPAATAAMTIDEIRRLGSTEVLDPAFATVGDLATVGAPVQESIAARVVVQPFTRGMALWLEADAGSIHVLHEDGTWREYRDSATAVRADPRLATNPLAKHFNPNGGFLRVWMHYDLEATLGWPQAAETALQSVTAQQFSQGFMMQPVPQWDAGRNSMGTDRILVVNGHEVGRWRLEPIAPPGPGSRR
jgi:hypothetical protein